MALHLIIDGYNFIRRSDRLQKCEAQALELGRQALIDDLASYKRIKGYKITVVFDGARNDEYGEKRSSEKGIRIRFSRHGQIADTVIENMASRDRQKAVVVTADRRLAESVESKGAVAVDPGAFEEKMEMARLLETKGAEANDGDRKGWVPTTRKKGPSRRLPKNKRRQLRKMKKL